MRALASMAMARVIAIPTCAHTAVATSRDRLEGLHAIAPTARMPTISARLSNPSCAAIAGLAPPVTSRRLALNNSGNSATVETY